jgi:hypothetical protein
MVCVSCEKNFESIDGDVREVIINSNSNSNSNTALGSQSLQFEKEDFSESRSLSPTKNELFQKDSALEYGLSDAPILDFSKYYKFEN